MAKYELQFPIEVDGKTISSVTLRRAKGKDMVAIGDHVAALARFYTANAKAVEKAISAGLRVGEGERNGPTPDDGDDIDVAAMTPPDASIYRAMVAVAGQLADLGDAAGDLDLVDLQEIAARAFNPGEARGRGGAQNGDAQ